MARHDEGLIVRSVWSLDRADPPVAITAGAGEVMQQPATLFALYADGRALARGEQTRGMQLGAARIVLACGTSWLVATAGARGVALRANGRPVPGPLAWLQHGDVVSVAAAGHRARFWVSSEGPAIAVRLDEEATDALSLESLAAGTVAVPCSCGAVFSPTSWGEMRRCPCCGRREDGVYHEQPEGFAAPVGEATA